MAGADLVVKAWLDTDFKDRLLKVMSFHWVYNKINFTKIIMNKNDDTKFVIPFDIK